MTFQRFKRDYCSIKKPAVVLLVFLLSVGSFLHSHDIHVEGLIVYEVQEVV